MDTILRFIKNFFIVTIIVYNSGHLSLYIYYAFLFGGAVFIAASLKLTATGRKTPSYSLKTDRATGQAAS